jgi:hypothetical protein
MLSGKWYLTDNPDAHPTQRGFDGSRGNSHLERGCTNTPNSAWLPH